MSLVNGDLATGAGPVVAIPRQPSFRMGCHRAVTRRSAEMQA
jgi:hypothetical protein